MEMTRLWTSKAVSEIGYDADSRTLRLIFRGSGGGYDYLDVDPEVYQGLTHSAHPWTQWRERVLQYHHRRLD